ncbi:ABC transporter ATP-binding protein [Kineococcus arenarius]|uniref:ABC transporter ATP-binding protein n=1 Tax=unclassified Kineococcus TaxID=2621656 RepID=UPI003D7E6DDA
MQTTHRTNTSHGGVDRQREEHDLVVSARGLSVDHGSYRAVDSIDLTVRRGEVFALLGTNGAGKTTALEALQGYRPRSAGDLTVFGEDPLHASAALRARTGVVLQESGHVPESTPRSVVGLWASLSSRLDDVDDILERVGLTHRRDTSVQKLSGGEKRRLDLALAVWGDPEFVVLDEPTTGLDPASRQTLWGIVRDLRAGGTTVLLTTHHLEEAESLADRVAIMHEGRVAVTGTLEEVLAARPAVITFDVRPGALPPAVRTRFDGLTVSRVRRAHRELDAVEIRTTSLPSDLLDLLELAREEGLPMDSLRATPASLEEVFHAVRRGEIGDGPVNGSTEED